MDEQPPFKPFPDPGILPTKPPPVAAERIIIRVDGYPPFKGGNHSLRNPRNPLYQRFVDLRDAATLAMDGRSWYDGEVDLKAAFLFPGETWPDKLLDDWPLPYISGIMDTIDGSHGMSFTYLPIVIQDDRQVRGIGWTVLDAESPSYVVEIEFL